MSTLRIEVGDLHFSARWEAAAPQTIDAIRRMLPGTPTDLSSAKPKQQVDIWTAAAPTTLKAQRGDDLALSASLVSIVAP